MSAREVYRSRATPEEIEDLLTKWLNPTIGTLNDDGSIHLAFVISLRRFYCETSSVTGNARNVKARPTASFIVQGRVSSGRSIMAENEGTARLVEGDEAFRVNRPTSEIHHRIRSRPGRKFRACCAEGRRDMCETCGSVH